MSGLPPSAQPPGKLVRVIPLAERKTLAARSADLKGSAALMRDLEPADACAIIFPVLGCGASIGTAHAAMRREHVAAALTAL
jgi:hypothetical protein